jgi:hypothetical protein
MSNSLVCEVKVTTHMLKLAKIQCGA